MFVYRANLPRTLMLVAALFSAPAATGAFAREFRAADVQAENDPTFQALRSTFQALRFMGCIIAERNGGAPQLGDAALIGTFVPAMPFLFHSSEHLDRALDGPIGRKFLNSFEPDGFAGHAFCDSGAVAALIERIRRVE
jgi:TRAP-type C4-dicarboxylate transport system substrate-binding protein